MGIRKIIVMITLTVLMVFGSSNVFASEYKDIEGNWAQPQIEDLINMDVLEGYGDNTIKPDGLITRAEFATMLAKAMDIQADNTSSEIYFRDVKPTDWYYGYITALKKLSIIDGYSDKTFKPGCNITRAEMLTMLVRISKSNLVFNSSVRTYKDVSLSYWAYRDIAIASRAGLIIQNGNNLYPDQKVARAEVAYSLDKMLWNQKSNLLSQQDLIKFASDYNDSVTDKYNTNSTDVSDLVKLSYGAQTATLSELAKRNQLYQGFGITTERQMTISNTTFAGSNKFAKVSFTYDLLIKILTGGNINTTSKKGTLNYFLKNTNDNWYVYSQEDTVNIQPLNKLNLTWDALATGDSFKEGIIQGLDVLSPTWFDVIDSNGNIDNRANEKYVAWAHNNGYSVWPLITNGFNPDITSNILKNPDLRKSVINKIVSYVDAYKFDGINVDFENMYSSDKDLYTQFIRELSAPLKSRGVLLSVDVTVISNSSWSSCYDRAGLADVVDYIALMTYDQHWSTCSQSGSVAQLSWVEDSLKTILNQVPKEKLLLGIPFYTREWKEVNGTVKSQALSMAEAKSEITNNRAAMVWDSVSGQYYAQYSKDGAIYKIWLEDEKSIDLKTQLVKKYDLAGVASWRAGFETKDIWTVLKDNLSVNN